VTADDAKQLAAIETVIQQRITREQEVGFVPKQIVPITAPRAGGPKKPKKLKKPKDYSVAKSGAGAGRGKPANKKTAGGRGGKPSSKPAAGRGRGTAGKPRKPAGRGR